MLIIVLTSTLGVLGCDQTADITGTPDAELAPDDAPDSVEVSDGEQPDSDAPDADMADLPATPQPSIQPPEPRTTDNLLAAAPPPPNGVSYTFDWRKNGNATGQTEPVLPASFTRKGEDWSVLVTAHRGQAQSASASAQVTIGNTAPECTAAALTPGAGGVVTAFECACSQRSDADVDDPVADTCIFAQGLLELPAPSCTLHGHPGLKKGLPLTCTRTPSDGEATGPSHTSAPVVLNNTAPIGGDVSVDPAQCGETETLTCLAQGASDPDTDPITWTYQWLVNNQPVEATGPTLKGSSFDKGDAVSCRATPYDGESPGLAVQSSNVANITNTPPALLSAHVSPAQAGRKESAECSWTGWSDVDPKDSQESNSADSNSKCAPIFVGWYSTDGELVAGFSSLTECLTTETGVSLVGQILGLSTLAVGDQVFCRATPYDGADPGVPRDSGVLTVVNYLPVVATANVVPLSPTAADTLECVAQAVSDADGDAFELTYSWTKNQQLLAAQTGPTLAGTFAKGDQVACSVVAADAYGAGLAAQAQPVTIANAVPVVSSVKLSTGSPSPCSVLSCSADVIDADSEAFELVWRWEIDGVSVPGAASASLPGDVVLEPGHKVACLVSAKDADSQGPEQVAGATVTNEAPSVAEVVVVPDSPFLSETLHCAVAGAVDPDCDVTVSLSTTWFVDGKPTDGAGAELDTTDLKEGATVSCSVTPHDGFDAGPAVISQPVVLAGLPPQAPKVSVVAPSGADGVVSCALLQQAEGAVDGDYVYYWSIGGQLETPGPATLPETVFTHCDRVLCRTVATVDGLELTSNTAQLVLPVGPGCEDGSDCTTHACHPSGGCLATAKNGAACDDGEPCTAQDSCLGATCQGSAADCSDNNPCTDDFCVQGQGCVHSGNNAPCDADGSVCTAMDTCSGSACVPGAAITCDDGSPCTTDQCDALAGCTTAPVNGDCDDQSPCTAQDKCVAGVCAGQPTNEKEPCELGEASAFCLAGTCQANTPPLAPQVALVPKAPVTGQAITCVATGGADPDEWPKPAKYLYEWTVNGEPVGAFGDELPGADVFKGETVTCAVFVSDGSALSAKTQASVAVGNASPTISEPVILGPVANGQLTCSFVVADPDDQNSDVASAVAWHVNGEVVEGQTGLSLASGFASDCDLVTCAVVATDGVASAEVESGALQLPAGDGCGEQPCVSWACNVGGGCQAALVDGPCEDQDPCTATGLCVSGVCDAPLGDPGACEDNNVCTADSCETGTGCVHAPVGGACDADASACTENDFCTGGECVAGLPLDCSDGIACTEDHCEASVGCVLPDPPPAADFGLEVGLYGGPDNFIKPADQAPLEIIQGPQGGLHLNIAYQLTMPLDDYNWSPLKTFVEAEIRTPCCDGEVIASAYDPVHLAFKVTDGQYITASVPVVFFGSISTPYIGETGCAVFKIGVYPQALGELPSIYSQDRHVFTMVDANPNG